MGFHPMRSICMALAAGALMILGNMTEATARDLHLSHDLQVTLDPDRHRLQAIDRIAVSGLGGGGLTFRMWPDLELERVRVNGQPADHSFRGGRLTLRRLPAAARLDVEIAYAGVYDDPAPVQPLNTDNPGFGVTGTIEEKGTMLLAGAGWYPRGKGRERFTITVDAPAGMVAVTSGRPLGHETTGQRTISRWSVEVPLRGLSLVAGRYQVKTRDFGGVVAATYFTEALQDLSDSYLEAIGRYLRMYSDLFGPYAFDQFAVVENFFPTGYGFPGFTLMGRRVLQLPFIIHTSLGHEVAHCWWGNGVEVDASEGNWSEGLTSYVADYLYKERAGKGLDHRRQWLRNYASLVNSGNVLALTNFRSRTDPATKAVGYDKAAMIFHMLRRKVGEEVFWGSLREIYKRYLFQAIKWNDIHAVFQKNAKRSLERFFKQWVHRPGGPDLTLSNVTVAADAGGFRVQGQLEQPPPYYHLRIDVALSTNGETHQRFIEINGRQANFALTVPDPPRQMTLDPEVNLFRQLSPLELPPTINRLKGSDSVLVVVASHLGERNQRLARRMALALGLPKARVGMAGEFSQQDLTASDVIFLGVSDHRKWQFDGNPVFWTDSQELHLLGEAYPTDSSSFFGVFANHRNPERLAALFIPGNPEFASVVSSKITHYGKYSYLVFKGSKNRVKGTWPVVNGPLVVRWSSGTALTTGGGGS